jgi:hypothetical protein
MADEKLLNRLAKFGFQMFETTEVSPPITNGPIMFISVNPHKVAVFVQAGAETKRRREKLDKYTLEYSLSQVFSPKQKDLFKKKLEGKPFTKTDQEYYSRTVKKKVVALANSELHTLARKLLEN